MLFISRIRLRNFKSFRVLNVELPSTMLCLAGPNGSGKSNVVDSIRFALGETSLKSLRARSVKDLIHTGAKTAEVTINFGGETDIEVKRVIRNDGKILYRLNGKRATRRSILETMKKYNLDESGRNVIAQGEVQRLLNMGGKERRMIIDSVAGIADFEQKKRESMGELETVEGRIREANLVLGERSAFLDELGREREAAIKFTETRKRLKDSRGTLLQRELEKLEKESDKLRDLEEKIDFNRNAKEQDMAGITAKIAEIDRSRSALSGELQSKQKANALIRRIEEIKASLGSKAQLIEDKEASVEKLKSEHCGMSKELENEGEKLRSLEFELEVLRKKLKSAEANAAQHGSLPKDERLVQLRSRADEAEAAFQEMKERLISLDAEITSKKELVEAKRQEAGRMLVEQVSGAQDESELERLKIDVSKAEREIEESFARTKEINKEIGELDRELLELKEKASIFKVRASPHLANPAFQLISDLKQKDGKRIYGTVADLLQFDSKYAHAVEAAAGPRLLYVVVDDVDTATSVIEKLKKSQSGRATFIPVSSVRVSKPVKMNGFSSIMDVVGFPEHVRNAMEYLFADTLLVDSVSDARKIGAGTARMVTLEGEIFERSGIISGGRAASSILMGNQLRKIESQLAETKARKDSLIQELYSLREDESRVRSHKSQLEVRMKAMEIEARAMQARAEEIRAIKERRSGLLSEITSLERLVDGRSSELEKLRAGLEAAQSRVSACREQLAAGEKLFLAESEASSRKREEAAAELSSVRATLEGKLKEQELRKKELRLREERLKQMEAERKQAIERVTEARRTMASERGELAKLEEQIASASREIEKIFGEMKSLEEQLQEMGRQRGEKRAELDRLMKDFNQLSVRKATNVTRLEDVRAEFSSYQDFVYLDKAGEDELRSTIAESERIIADMGNVNMAAIEMFDRKKAEIDDARQKISKLSDERQAILQMISEIEEHKKEAFFEAFEAVSDNFRKVFTYVTIGEGYLYLDNPNEPFESGLHIKIKRGNQEHSLNSLSGGETTLVALMFMIALQFYKPSPFYILDEVDAALDKPNSRNLAEICRNISKDSQVIMVSHNDNVMSGAETVLGVAKVDGASKLVGVKLKQAMENRSPG